MLRYVLPTLKSSLALHVNRIVNDVAVDMRELFTRDFIKDSHLLVLTTMEGFKKILLELYQEFQCVHVASSLLLKL